MQATHFIKTVLLSAALCLGAAQASAETFDFTFTGAGSSGMGTLNGVANGDGTFTATTGTGSLTIGADTRALTLAPNPNAPGTTVSPSGIYFYDNQLFPGGILLSSCVAVPTPVDIAHNPTSPRWPAPARPSART
jgi:hypothetical protein